MYLDIVFFIQENYYYYYYYYFINYDKNYLNID